MATKTNPFILYKFASRSRPEKFFNGLDNIINLSDKKDFAILVSADLDDTTMFNSSVRKRLQKYIDDGYVFPFFDYSKSKIHAINRDLDKIPNIPKIKNWDILVNFSDDMEFIVYGFDNIIREKFKQLYPDFDGNLHFNDGFAQDRVCAMSIMGKKYFQRFNYIYHPSYISLWCDNEYTEVARMLRKITYFPNPIFKHNHPANIPTIKPDEQLKKTESFYSADGKTYHERKLKHFNIL